MIDDCRLCRHWVVGDAHTRRNEFGAGGHDVICRGADGEMEALDNKGVVVHKEIDHS